MTITLEITDIIVKEAPKENPTALIGVCVALIAINILMLIKWRELIKQIKLLKGGNKTYGKHRIKHNS